MLSILEREEAARARLRAGSQLHFRAPNSPIHCLILGSCCGDQKPPQEYVEFLWGVAP